MCFHLPSVASAGRARPAQIVKDCRAASEEHAIRPCNACAFLALLVFFVTKVSAAIMCVTNIFLDFLTEFQFHQQFAAMLATRRMAIVERLEHVAAKSAGWAMIVAW